MGIIATPINYEDRSYKLEIGRNTNNKRILIVYMKDTTNVKAQYVKIIEMEVDYDNYIESSLGLSND